MALLERFMKMIAIEIVALYLVFVLITFFFLRFHDDGICDELMNMLSCLIGWWLILPSLCLVYVSRGLHYVFTNED